MTSFALLAALLVTAVVIALAWPLLRPRAAATDEAPDQGRANLAILRDQMTELEHERAEGSLSEAAFVQARDELQRRLLDEAQQAGNDAGSRSAIPAKRTTLAVALLVPVLAAGLYATLGNPAALDPAKRTPKPEISAGQIEGMVEKLAARLPHNPDDPQGWVMLARSYKVLGRYPEAAEAYAKGETVVSKDASLLTDYAEALAMSSGGQLAGKPAELIARALAIDPKEPQALLMAGAAASERGDHAAAAGFWQRLLDQMPADGEEAKILRDAIEQAKNAR